MRWIITAGVLAVAVSGLPARAQDYPTRPITMIVPSPPGGPTDAIGRILADRLRVSLGQPVVIENVAGAAGSIGVGRVARAQPDGHTIGLGQWSHYVINGAAQDLPYDTLRDFEPVALLSTAPQLIIGRKSHPATDLRDLIAWLKANHATAATGGTGSPPHVFGLLFGKLTGTQFTFVPYRGGGPALAAVVAGHHDFMIDLAANSVPQVHAATIKAYAVAASSRLAAAPEIPTVDEAGLPGFYGAVWHGLWVPAKTPKSIIATLNGAVVAAMSEPDVRKQLDRLGQDIFPRAQQTPDALRAHHRAEIEKWWPIVKAAGIKAQ